MRGLAKGRDSVKIKILFLIVTVFLIAGTLSHVREYFNAKELILSDSAETLEAFQNIFKNELETKTNDMSLAMELLLRNKAITEAFAQRNRQELTNLTLEFFKDKMKTKYGIIQFQFHTPVATSFLRVHQPSKHSDDLSAFRHTVVNVNTLKKPVIGLEVGRGELGLRVVYPVVVDGSHVGSAEFGADVEPVLSMAANTTGTQYAVGIFSEVFKEAKRFENKPEDIVKDNIVFFQFFGSDVQKLLTKISLGKKNELYRKDNNTFAVNAFPIKDYSGADIGKILVLKDITTSIKNMEKNLIGQAIGMLLSVIIITTIIYFMILSLVVRPLENAADITNRLADGDLSIDITIKGKDEIGMFFLSMKNMVERLRCMIESVRSASENVASASYQQTAASEQMTSGIVEQANKASQILHAASDMAQIATNVAHSTTDIMTSASETLSIASDGEGIVSRTNQEVQGIEVTVVESSQVMKNLGERSKQIGEIVVVINDIAEQTNLIALNAAIEAARAGEHGRGFAVVADEVRKLAEKTGKATTEINKMIATMQTETNAALSSMQGSLNKVETATQFSTKAGEALHTIVQSIQELQTKIEEISSSTQKMSTTAEDIGKDIEVVARVSNETSSSASELSNSAQNLASLSDDLKEIVNQFRLSGNKFPDDKTYVTSMKGQRKLL
ncbi:MAG: methyl-accepting chemotaxis protein [Nitrospirae bacterium]|nr:methyl-accepting chemotaxis protein [Nitrospirota bacterium]